MSLEYIVASTAHPFFKLRWVPSDHVGQVRDLFLTKAAAENDTLGDEAALTNSTSTNTDDFFSFNDDSTAEPTTNSTSMECLQYLEDKAHTH